MYIFLLWTEQFIKIEHKRDEEKKGRVKVEQKQFATEENKKRTSGQLGACASGHLLVVQ